MNAAPMSWLSTLVTDQPEVNSSALFIAANTTAAAANGQTGSSDMPRPARARKASTNAGEAGSSPASTDPATPAARRASSAARSSRHHGENRKPIATVATASAATDPAKAAGDTRPAFAARLAAATASTAALIGAVILSSPSCRCWARGITSRLPLSVAPPHRRAHVRPGTSARGC